jgi:hypothetical protein
MLGYVIQNIVTGKYLLASSIYGLRRYTDNLSEAAVWHERPDAVWMSKVERILVLEGLLHYVD